MPAVFWISNPNNDFIGCAAAGAVNNGAGFWYDVPEHPKPGSISADPTYFCRQQPMGLFTGNRAHSIGGDAGLSPDGGGWGVAVDFDNGVPLRDYLFPGLNIFKTGGIPFYAGGVTAGTATLSYCSVSGDTGVQKGNIVVRESLFVAGTHTANLPTATPQTFAAKAYDGTVVFVSSVLVGFKSLITELFPTSGGSWLNHCEQLDGRGLQAR